jgi:hypothetical protein
LPRKLVVIPCTLAEANEFVRTRHRHHGTVIGCKFCVAVCLRQGNSLGPVVGVAIVGRPVSRVLDDGWALEVTRVCTDGTQNACSALYGASRRASFALGYKRLVTYTLADEGGASLRGAGWRCIGEAGGGSWSCPSRPRVDTHPMQRKIRWEAESA